MKIEDLPGAIIADAVMERHGFKVIDEKLIPCVSCNPDGNAEFDLSTWVWCNDCRGHGFIWMRTVQLEQPVDMISIDLKFGFYFGDEK